MPEPDTDPKPDHAARNKLAGRALIVALGVLVLVYLAATLYGRRFAEPREPAAPPAATAAAKPPG